MQRTRSEVNERIDWYSIVTKSQKLLRRLWWLLLIAAILGGAYQGFRTWRSYRPHYSARAVISVQADTSMMGTASGSSTSLNIKAAQQVINTFPAIIETDAMRDRLCRELGTSSINGTVTPAAIANTNLFTLTVTSERAEDAYQILNAVLKCYPEAASIVIGATQLAQIEAPVMPSAPSNTMNLFPAIWRGVWLSAVLMLVLLCLVAQFWQYVDGVEDMKRITNLSCLASVPHVAHKRRTKNHALPDMLSDSVPPAFEETIRVLRTRVLRQLQGKEHPVIVVTSTVPGEGKTTVAANLALSLAQTGIRVVLVDGDLRTQELRARFHIEKDTQGLSSLLRSGSDKVVSSLTQIPNTSLQLLCGDTMDKPMSILKKRQLASLLDRLKAVADVVLIDTPPIGLLADASVFAQCADYSLYVVCSGSTNVGAIADGLQAMSEYKAKLMGYVLNGVMTAEHRSGYRYGYKYGYKYGSRYGYRGYGSRKEDKKA